MNVCQDCGQENRTRDLTTFEGVTRCPDCHEEMLSREDPDYNPDYPAKLRGNVLVLDGKAAVYLEWRVDGEDVLVTITDNRSCLIHYLRVPGSGADASFRTGS